MASIFEGQPDPFYTEATVGIQWLDMVISGVPAGGKPLDYFINSKFESDEEKADFRARIKAGEATDDEQEAAAVSSMCVFERDYDGDVCIWHNNIKAALRECCTALGLTQLRHSTMTKEQAKDILAKPKCMLGGKNEFQHCMHIKELRVKLLIDGKPVKEPTGTRDFVKHIDGPSGPRSAIGRHEYMMRPTAEFHLSWPRRGAFETDEVLAALRLLEPNGVSACRSQGQGKLEVTLFDIKK